jgi:hypothetical protein
MYQSLSVFDPARDEPWKELETLGLDFGDRVSPKILRRILWKKALSS